MPTPIDTKVLDKLPKIILKYGLNVVFEYQTGGAYNAATDSIVGATATTRNVMATPPEAYSERMYDGNTIRYGDTRIFVANKDLGFEPTPGMNVVIQGDRWEVITAIAHWSGTLKALWELQLRK